MNATYLRAHEINEWNCSGTRQSHPKPNLPADVLKCNTTGKDSDERKEPFSKCTGRGTNMTEFQRRDLRLCQHDSTL